VWNHRLRHASTGHLGHAEVALREGVAFVGAQQQFADLPVGQRLVVRINDACLEAVGQAAHA